MTSLEEESAAVVQRAQEERERLDREAEEKFAAATHDMPVVFWNQPFILRFGPDDSVLVITDVSKNAEGRMTFGGEDWSHFISDRTFPGRAGG